MRREVLSLLSRPYSPLVLSLLLVGSPAVSQTPKPFVGDTLLELELAVGGGFEAKISPTTGLVTFLAFDPGQQPFVRLPITAKAEDRALAFLDDYGAAFGIMSRDWVSPIRSSALDEVGMEHVRLRQTFNGVPVTGGELVVHLRGNEVVAVNAKALSDLDHAQTTPTVGPDAAEKAVWFYLDRRLGVSEAMLSEPRLELFNRGLLEGRRGWTRPAWFVEATANGLREYVWVDAESGAVLLGFSQLTEARSRFVYDADDPNDGVYGTAGTLVRSEGGAPTGDADADAAYDYSGDTYDYFFNEHGRDSYDDAGGTLDSVVHFCLSAGDCPYGNAFWSGSKMWYGEGYSLADDIVAHELTHAVTDHTADLYYYMQSGALNESYSDIFGETVDLTNGAGIDTPGVRWLLGEDFPGGFIRDMLFPHLSPTPQPGRMSDPNFWCLDDQDADDGGVHLNSGVPNLAYVLMVDGGSYNGKTVAGMGLTKAGKIWYRALAHYLISASDFLDAYNALKQSCEDLIGTASITGSNCFQLGEALDAVEMSSPWPCSPSQGTVPALCPAEQAPDLWHHLDMESVVFTDCPAITTATGWCLNSSTSLYGAFATSGEKSLWGYNKPTADYFTVAVGPPGTLPAGALMQFNHSHGFENSSVLFFDGGIVIYSTDSGSTWFDGGSLITGGHTYGGTINWCCLNPLAGYTAFVADSWGFTASQLNLSALAGETFWYGFGIGTDFVEDDRGWFVDDIRIYTCSACVTNRVLSAEYNGLASFYGASISVEAGVGFKVGAMETVTLQAPEVRLTNNFEAYGDLAIKNASCP